MSENYRPPSFPEQLPELTDGDPALASSDWAAAAPSQASPAGVPSDTVPIPGFEDASGLSNGDRPRHGKLPIPRATHASNWPSSGRVSRACENCREQKAKCSGHRPVCHRCQEAGVRCSYGDRKREKMVKQISDLTTQVQTYQTLLRDLYPRLDRSSAQHVDQILSEVSFHFPGAPTLPKISSSSLTASSTSHTTDRTNLPSRAVDYTEEDFNRDGKVQAMGFVGEHSEMAWLYRLKRELEQDETPIAKQNAEPLSISSVNYTQDDSDFSVLEDADPLWRPPQPIAGQLVDRYFRSVHPGFPVIGKTVFLSQYRSFYSKPNVLPGNRWLAVLNLVFAIASRQALLVENQPLDEHNDHRAYYSRAWWLSMGNLVLLDHPNLQQVQVEGLATFYLVSIGQINRSWRLIGIAIRSAVTMGLNLRSETDSISYLSKETRYRVWWALFRLDTVLSVMTGRPPSSGEMFCTTPLPVPYKEEDFGNERVVQLITSQETRNTLMNLLLSNGPEASPSGNLADRILPARPESSKGKQPEQPTRTMVETLSPNISLYFLYVVDLEFLMRAAINTLYAPAAARRSWIEIESAISAFNTNADNWLCRLPAEFHFTEMDIASPFSRQCTSLAFRFYTTKITITQPCLGRLAYRQSKEGSPGAVCDTMAAICVRTACQVLDFLPDKADLTCLYEISPWWCVLHYVMQSTTVLLVDLFTHAVSSTSESASLVQKVKKAIRWLREMSSKDASSRRALLVCTDLISQHGAKVGLQIDTML